MRVGSARLAVPPFNGLCFCSAVYNGRGLGMFGSKSTTPMLFTEFKKEIADRMKPADWKDQCVATVQDCEEGTCKGGLSPGGDVVQN